MQLHGTPAIMADQHRDDDEVLADLERSLADLDPDLAHRLTGHTTCDHWPIRSLTLSWLLWTTTWFVVFVVTHNPAALVLACTFAVGYPLGLAAALWWRRPPCRPPRRRRGMR